MPFIDKQYILKFAQNDEERLALSKVYDAYMISEKTGRAKFTGFQTPRILDISKSAFREANLEFIGGIKEAERCIIAFNKEEFDEAPIRVLHLTGNFSCLTHRDFLGSILGLSITRENIGDIIKKDNEAYVFVLSQMADFVMMNLTSIGRESVKVDEVLLTELTIEKEFEEVKKSVASLRADACLAAIFNISRTDAVDAIKRGDANLNYVEVADADKKIKEGDVFSLRGKGKAIIKEVGDLSKKGRQFITIKKYK